MTALRFHLDKGWTALIVVGLVVFLSYDLADYLLRMAEPPRDLQALAGRQLESVILAGAVGAAMAAAVTARHHHRSGRDYAVASARPPLGRVGAQFVATAVPLSVAWLLFVVISGVRSGLVAAAAPAAAVIIVSVAALCVSAAMGQLVGTLLRPLLAIPVAFLASYAYAATFAILGDNSWLQWLGTGFGDSLSQPVKTTWILGELLWFTGLTLAIIGACAFATSQPHRLPRTWLISVPILLTAGIILLYLTGADATHNPSGT
ncbi:hypothetical protein [Micromonospora sp. WMMD1082]|uniref:hypothetical protein n=1 Tax=Micromonospora sp. WMMD1082 TaxID=3016104 RepID=UPI0024173FC9|nr:hypothetical protein [Micromonospora sp. WMMD1082]MDG4795425.1 hypothetical protein [Micromonospora sp. WMMD1082]